MPMTSPLWKGKGDAIGGSRCIPAHPEWPGSRVISPAWGAVTGEEIGGVAQLGCTSWPNEALAVGNVTTRDRSHLSNYSTDEDTFLQCTGWNRTAVPFIAIVDPTHWGDSRGVLHGHGTAFNKIWTMGTPLPSPLPPPLLLLLPVLPVLLLLLLLLTVVLPQGWTTPMRGARPKRVAGTAASWNCK